MTGLMDWLDRTPAPPGPPRFVGLMRADAYRQRLIDGFADSILGIRTHRELPRVEERQIREVPDDRELSRIPWRP